MYTLTKFKTLKGTWLNDEIIRGKQHNNNRTEITSYKWGKPHWKSVYA